MGARIAFDHPQPEMDACLRGDFLDHEIETQMTGHSGLASRHEFLREALHSQTERRARGKSFVTHDKVRRGTSDEGFYDIINNQRVRAVFSPLNKLLQYPRSELGDGVGWDVITCLAHRAKRQERHIWSKGVFDAYGFQDVFDFWGGGTFGCELFGGRGGTVEELKHGVFGRDMVSFRYRQAEILGSLNKNVFLMQHASRGNVELNWHAACTSLDDLLGLSLFNRGE